jgi:hypothetical protein
MSRTSAVRAVENQENKMPGKWTSLTAQPPFDPATMLLLTDGAVICNASNSQNWWKLSPDAGGGYINGTWSQIASMKNARLYYASAVLADGRVFVAGGEYNGGDSEVELDAAEIYDPISDQWSDLTTPGWGHVGDAPCCVLTDGRLLLGDIASPQAAIWDPASKAWTPTGPKDDACSEETWTLLPDGSVLTAECTNHPKAERYIPASNSWIPTGSIPAGSDLVEQASIEIGPALLLPNGKVLGIGATGHTAIYTPDPDPTKEGVWTAGPPFEQLRQAKDAPACLLPNGRVLCTVGTAAVGENYPGPTYFYEFDGANLVKVDDPPNAADTSAGPFDSRLLLLPTGDVLFAKSGAVWAYTPDVASGQPDPAWLPAISSAPSVVAPAGTYPLAGFQLTGLSQAVSYGDDAAMATNYPIVRIDIAGSVFYARTFGFSDMGVARGRSFTQSCQVTFPQNLPLGNAMLSVITNGIQSQATPIAISTMPAPPFDAATLNILKNGLTTGPLWLMDAHGPSPLLLHGEAPPPNAGAVEAEVRKIYSDLIASYGRLRELGRSVLPPGKK